MDGKELRVAAIEAEALGMKALGTDYNRYSQSTPQNKGLYKGEIVAENAAFVVQKITPLHTVRHLKDKLEQAPQVGQTVRIGYSADTARVSEVPKRTKKLVPTL